MRRRRSGSLAATQAALEAQISAQIESVRCGELPRRSFIQGLAAYGIGTPMAGLLLAEAGLARAASPAAASASAVAYTPSKRGGGGTLRILIWQGPTLLNPHFAVGQKDLEGSRPFYEPLIAWDDEANIIPVLAAEIPSRENGGIAADGKSVVWKLKPGVTWHDGKPFTADDVVFNAVYSADPATATFTTGYYQGLRFEKVDALTVRVRSDAPQPFWPGTYSSLQLLPRHLFERFRGSASRDAPNNLVPVGTGPYKFVDFRPGDQVRGVLNPNYHLPNRPFFDTLEIKGGGDAVSAARAVLQTGEFDFAWNLQVEDEILRRLESAGQGRAVAPLGGGSVEWILLNHADPNAVVDGERASPKSLHPAFSDPAVRQAMALLVDRRSIESFVYGRAGRATPNVLNAPASYRSPNIKAEFDVAKANAVLEAAGWKRGADGVRAKGGRRLAFVFQTSINAPRQKTQAIVKQAAQQAGIALELKPVTGAVFFSSDPANPDTLAKFWADMQMFTNSMGTPDPEGFMRQFLSSLASSQANKWQGRNVGRWRNDAFDAAFKAAETELDPVKRTALYIQMNDLICNDHYLIPIVQRPLVVGVGRKLVAPQTGWGVTTELIHDWFRQA